MYRLNKKVVGLVEWYPMADPRGFLDIYGKNINSRISKKIKIIHFFLKILIIFFQWYFLGLYKQKVYTIFFYSIQDFQWQFLVLWIFFFFLLPFVCNSSKLDLSMPSVRQYGVMWSKFYKVYWIMTFINFF